MRRRPPPALQRAHRWNRDRVKSGSVLSWMLSTIRQLFEGDTMRTKALGFLVELRVTNCERERQVFFGMEDD
jgi:hypothetical protein